jgi:hypothetical protein
MPVILSTENTPVKYMTVTGLGVVTGLAHNIEELQSHMRLGTGLDSIEHQLHDLYLQSAVDEAIVQAKTDDGRNPCVVMVSGDQSVPRDVSLHSPDATDFGIDACTTRTTYNQTESCRFDACLLAANQMLDRFTTVLVAWVSNAGCVAIVLCNDEMQGYVKLVPDTLPIPECHQSVLQIILKMVTCDDFKLPSFKLQSCDDISAIVLPKGCLK